MWYAPKRIPSTVDPDRLSGKVRSVNVVPSVALAKTNEFPVPATAIQSIWRCQFETSIPVSPPTFGCALAGPADASTTTASTARKAAAICALRLWTAASIGGANLPTRCLDAVRAAEPRNAAEAYAVRIALKAVHPRR